MLRFSGGDARKLLNILELVVQSETEETVVITDEMVTERLQQNPLAYDKDGEMHYDIISLSSSLSAVAILTERSTGLPVWWKEAKIRLSLPADW